MKQNKPNILLITLASIFFVYILFLLFQFTNNSIGPREIGCTMEAKICPDGSSVGRVGPKCEFSPCSDVIPTSIPLKTYINQKYGFQFDYSDDVFKYLSPSDETYLSSTKSSSPITLGPDDLWVSVSVDKKTNQKDIPKMYFENKGPQVIYGFRSLKIVGNQAYKIEMSSFSSESILSSEKYFDQIISSFIVNQSAVVAPKSISTAKQDCLANKNLSWSTKYNECFESMYDETITQELKDICSTYNGKFAQSSSCRHSPVGQPCGPEAANVCSF